jgi:hypothetical protein
MRLAFRSFPSLVALVLASAVAGTATATPRSSAASASFCSNAKSVAKQLASAASGLSNTASLAQREAQLKQQFATLEHAKSTLFGSVPGRLKPSLTAAYRYIDFVSAKLSAIHWNFSALAQKPQTVAALVAAADRAKAPLAALDTYFRKTCHFKV